MIYDFYESWFLCNIIDTIQEFHNLWFMVYALWIIIPMIQKMVR